MVEQGEQASMVKVLHERVIPLPSLFFPFPFSPGGSSLSGLFNVIHELDQYYPPGLSHSPPFFFLSPPRRGVYRPPQMSGAEYPNAAPSDSFSPSPSSDHGT